MSFYNMKRRGFISQLSCMGVSTFGFRNLDFISPFVVANEGKVSFSNTNAGIMISVKVVKAKAEFCVSPPCLQFHSSNNTWSLSLDHNGDHNGENLREIYYNIESKTDDFCPMALKIIAPGVKAARVIIGYTDIPFEQTGDLIQFLLIDDRSRGQQMQLEYQSPLGGYPISFLHNWEIRKAGEYASKNFSAVEFAAVNNYLVAAQEVLRQMGNMGPGSSKPFKGDIVLMGSEVASTRGHMDYPPHIHIMHYEYGKVKYKDWISRLVPHFYMDKAGNIIHNTYAKLAGRGTESGEYGSGDVVRFEDSTGTHIIDLIIDKEGLILRPPDGRIYSIRPDPLQGAANAVYGYFNDKAICRAEVKDYPDIGTFRIQLDILNKEKVEKTIYDGYLYDPFTAHKFRELY